MPLVKYQDFRLIFSSIMSIGKGNLSIQFDQTTIIWKFMIFFHTLRCSFDHRSERFLVVNDDWMSIVQANRSKYSVSTKKKFLTRWWVVFHLVHSFYVWNIDVIFSDHTLWEMFIRWSVILSPVKLEKKKRRRNEISMNLMSSIIHISFIACFALSSSVRYLALLVGCQIERDEKNKNNYYWASEDKHSDQ